MASLAQSTEALNGVCYERHRPEQTLLYQLVNEYYPQFIEQLTLQGKTLPNHVQQEFDAYLKCGRLEHGFLRVRCESCHFERLVAFSVRNAAFAPAVARGAWPRAQPCWLMLFSLPCRCANG